MRSMAFSTLRNDLFRGQLKQILASKEAQEMPSTKLIHKSLSDIKFKSHKRVVSNIPASKFAPDLQSKDQGLNKDLRGDEEKSRLTYNINEGSVNEDSFEEDVVEI